jgi:FkbM family methyltransferase
MINPFTLVRSVEFLDIGASGELDRKWSALYRLLNFTGFEPNAEECERLSKARHPFKAARYLPFALAGTAGEQTMYKTQGSYCYSLLRPNLKWINRFTYSHLFQDAGTTTVVCQTLDEASRQYGLSPDILKIDTQGMELPILRSGESVLAKAFCVETENGFVTNYVGETTYAQMDEYLRSKGFLMFNMQTWRVGRKNEVGERELGRRQPIWCETTWLYDYIGNGAKPARDTALRALLICKAVRCYDFGLELAAYFREHGLLEAAELEYLRRPEHWWEPRENPRFRTSKVLNILPYRLKRRLYYALHELVD